MDLGMLASLLLVVAVVLGGLGYVYVRGKEAQKAFKKRQQVVLPEE
jgi:hypothetical protein